MARKAIATNVADKIATRLAFLAVAQENGNKTAAVKAETIVWTLNAAGFSPEVVSEITAKASELSADMTDDGE